MGQIRQVSRKVGEDGYLIYFYDEMKQIEDPGYCGVLAGYCQSFTTLILDTDDLVKLHFCKQDPALGNKKKYYTTQKTSFLRSADLIEKTVREGESTLNEFQADLDSVIETSKEKDILIEHNLMSSRFDPVNLVTIVHDFATRQENKNIVTIVYDFVTRQKTRM